MSNLVLPVAALAFATWAVYLGGLASLQADCQPESDGGALTRGLSSATNCSKAYRLWWFYMCWEIVTILIAVGAAVSGKLASLRSAITGLFAVGTALFIDVANAGLTALDSADGTYWGSGSPLSRLRTVTAGAIMTAALNALVILVAGGAVGETTEDKAVAEKAGAV